MPGIENSLRDLESLCKLLNSGKHSKAVDSETALTEAKKRMDQLASSAQEFANYLNASRERELKLEDLLKEFTENGNTVKVWESTITSLLSNSTWQERGCGISTIEDLVDEFIDDYKNQENNIGCSHSTHV